MQAWKKQLILWTVILVLAAGAAALLPGLKLLRDAGYTLIGWGRWELELTTLTLVLIVVIGFILFYAALRLISLAVNFPLQQKQKKEARQREAAFRRLVEGMREAAEGNWERAEKTLIENAAVSSQSLAHYLTAARFAHHRGAKSERDTYLKQAYEAEPDAQLAVRLTEAELHLADENFDQALESLTQLEKVAPRNARVLRLLHEAYAKLEDWEALHKLLPRLHENKVLLEAEVHLLELETYSAMLRERSAAGDAETLQAHWQELPEHMRQLPDLQAIYFAAMIECGAGERIDAPLRAALEKHWEAPLLILYGGLELPDATAHLQQAEQWLKQHPDDPVLLQVLGKLAWRTGQSEQAETYLHRSLKIQPSVEAYRLLGDLLEEKNAWKDACEYYRRGMMLASQAVIEEVQAHPEG
ncbi:MAG: heme biosynthesis protein HemY [Methylohalobius crimeensis]